MSEPASGFKPSIRSLILVPAAISLVITLLRLTGELAHWSSLLFNPAAGGGGAIVGISWLPLFFGPYFAVKLRGSGQGAPSLTRAFGFTLLGWVIAIAGGFVGFAPQFQFHGKEGLGILIMALGASIVTLGWPALFRTLAAYGYAARIPVAIVMFFAMRGHWGTHYDALPPRYQEPASFLAKYLQIALVPQLILWVAFTILVGSLVGTITVALAFRGRTASAAS
jgi:hypothetical protein